MDKNKAIELATQYKEALSEILNIKDLYLYGSYSKNTYTSESDIDIAVVVDNLSEDYFNDTPLLWKIRRKISNLIEPVLLTPDSENPLYSDIIATGIRI
ncbi:MAG: nucleotidyltransferase domain-containing protein [Muribaculaceae bacterium]|nr:nucleotidyltransferase domain-containing protein [Muribaculaceae bacterium]